jgi:hypothetical protein
MDGNREREQPRNLFRENLFREDETDDHYLPTISLIHVPHHNIPDLYQRCFEYVEPWQWSPVTELVETGQWFFAAPSVPPNQSPPSANSGP